MPLRLYIDEDAMSRALIRGLRAEGIEVSTPLDENKLGETDAEQLEFATRMNRVFCTFNVGDFCRLHKDYVANQREPCRDNRRLQTTLRNWRTNPAFIESGGRNGAGANEESTYISLTRCRFGGNLNRDIEFECLPQ